MCKPTLDASVSLSTIEVELMTSDRPRSCDLVLSHLRLAQQIVRDRGRPSEIVPERDADLMRTQTVHNGFAPAEAPWCSVASAAQVDRRGEHPHRAEQLTERAEILDGQDHGPLPLEAPWGSRNDPAAELD
jgi:hypothetical protein